MKIDVICPLYNAENYIDSLNNSFLMQEKVQIANIKYILTESSDKSEEKLIFNNCKYEVIPKSDFSHSLVREKAAFESKADIIVFVTQDVKIVRKDWLYNLTKDINNEIVATYSRQIAKDSGLEKYTREVNYPVESKIVSKNDIETLGLKTFFFSDASSAVKRSIFVKLNGYDGKKIPISEDMYLAYKIIMNGYKIKYCSDSEVIHSHNFSLKEVYNRYKLTGRFFKENSYLDKYGTTKAGGGLAKQVLWRALKDFNIKVLFRYPFDMAARLLGMKAGQK